MKLWTLFKKILPWLITAAALVIAFRDIDWAALVVHAGEASLGWVIVALLLTSCSYIARSRRWQSLFPELCLSLWQSYRVLILGFFMNNVLPARTGELVRAHLGHQASKQPRALVLATIASERLLDGLTLSLFFVIFAFNRGDQEIGHAIAVGAAVFIGAAICMLLVVTNHARLHSITEFIESRFKSKAIAYALTRAHTFMEGLTPLFQWRRLPLIILYSLAIWTVELGVFFSAGWAFNIDLSLSDAVLFMVTVNFSSLIPAAPGGLGVIEAIGSTVLISIGIDKEPALAMVLLQHAVQYLVVGIPGLLLLTFGNAKIRSISDEQSAPLSESSHS